MGEKRSITWSPTELAAQENSGVKALKKANIKLIRRLRKWKSSTSPLCSGVLPKKNSPSCPRQPCRWLDGYKEALSAFWSNLPLFWRFQLIGWLCISLATFPTKISVCGNLPCAIGSFLLWDGISFLLTLGMRWVYQDIYLDHLTSTWIAAAVFGGSAVATLVQVLLFETIGGIFPYEEKTIFGQFATIGILFYRGGQFLGWSVLYFAIKIWLEAQAKEKKLEEERQMRQEAELQMLRSLTNSHFLTNALNTIQKTLDTGREGASKMIQSLADYLNYSLRHRSDNFVPLGEEVDALGDYLTLQKARWGSALDYGIQLQEDLVSAEVPGFVLQPLVENAIKYGRESESGKVSIRVVVQQDGNNLLIDVFNTGRWIQPDAYRQSGGVGLDTIKGKLQWLYPNQHSFTTLEEEGWVTVSIRIPVIL